MIVYGFYHGKSPFFHHHHLGHIFAPTTLSKSFQIIEVVQTIEPSSVKVFKICFLSGWHDAMNFWGPNLHTKRTTLHLRASWKNQGITQFHMTNMLFNYKSSGSSKPRRIIIVCSSFHLKPKPHHTIILFSYFETTGARSLYFPSVDGLKLWVPNLLPPSDRSLTKTWTPKTIRILKHNAGSSRQMLKRQKRHLVSWIWKLVVSWSLVISNFWHLGSNYWWVYIFKLYYYIIFILLGKNLGFFIPYTQAAAWNFKVAQPIKPWCLA